MTFEWPFLLISLLLVPGLIALYLAAQNRRQAQAVVFSDLDLLREVSGNGPGWRRHLPAVLFLLGLIAVLFGLARPSATLRLPRQQSSVVLVMDVSPSMTATDLQPNRLDAAKQAARNFVGSLPANTSVGLVSFSAKANLNAPLTRDHEAVLQALASLRTDNGTAIGDGLLQALDHIAAQSLTELRPITSVSDRSPVLIILLSDGESTEGTPLLQAVARAAQARVQINTVGIGQRDRRTAISNSTQQVGLDESTLQAIAQQTGGRYFYAAEGRQLEQIYSNLGSQMGWVEENTEITALFAGLGAILILLAAIFSLRWTGQMLGI